MIKPDGMRQEVFERYIKDGFTQEDIYRIQKETEITRGLIRKILERREKHGPREITSAVYKRAIKRQEKEVSGWLTGRRVK